MFGHPVSLYFIWLKRSIGKIHLQNVMSGSNAAFVVILMINVLCFQEQSWCFLLITTTVLKSTALKWFPLHHESSSKTFSHPLTYFTVFWILTYFRRSWIHFSPQYSISKPKMTHCVKSPLLSRKYISIKQISAVCLWMSADCLWYLAVALWYSAVCLWFSAVYL